MLCLSITDVLEAWSGTNNVIDCSIHGMVGIEYTRLYTGTLGNVANVVVYTATEGIAIVSIVFTNTDAAAATVNLKLDPANGGNDKFLLPVAISLEPGNSLVFDGQRFQVMDTVGQVLQTFGEILPAAKGGTGISSYAVGDLIYASGVTTLSKLADVAVGQVLISGGVGVAPSWSGSPWVSGTFGIGTATVPHGGIGTANFAIDSGTPSYQITDTADNYPVFGFYSTGHDVISLYFDSYQQAGEKSSDVGSNYRIIKTSDLFKIQYDSGIAQGAAVTWNEGIVMNITGQLGFNTTTPGIINGIDITTQRIFHVDGGSMNARISIEGNASAAFDLVDKGGALNQKWVFFHVDAEKFFFQSLNDASAVVHSFFVGSLATGNTGIATLNPGQIFDVNQGSGNMVADGYDLHSLGRYKEDIMENRGGYLEKLIHCPPKTFRRKPYIPSNDIRDATISMFGKKKWKKYFPKEDSHRNEALFTMPDGEMKTWIDNWCEKKRVNLRKEKKWQRELIGLIADDSDLQIHLPEVISKNDHDKISGISLSDYIGVLHAAIVELAEGIN